MVRRSASDGGRRRERIDRGPKLGGAGAVTDGDERREQERWSGEDRREVAVGEAAAAVSGSVASAVVLGAGCRARRLVAVPVVATARVGDLASRAIRVRAVRVGRQAAVQGEVHDRGDQRPEQPHTHEREGRQFATPANEAREAQARPSAWARAEHRRASVRPDASQRLRRRGQPGPLAGGVRGTRARRARKAPAAATPAPRPSHTARGALTNRLAVPPTSGVRTP